MNGYSSYGGRYMGPPPPTVVPPRQSSLQGGDTRLEPYGPQINHRASESSSLTVSFDGSRRSSDSSKPRLSKDQQSFLEREFATNQKPKRELKEQFAERIGVSSEKINNWFQNKRAKSRQDEKKRENQTKAYQNYLQNQHDGFSNQPPSDLYNQGYPGAPMGHMQSQYTYGHPMLNGTNEPSHDASMEPSLDVDILERNVPQGLYTHFNFDDVQPQPEPPADDNMASFLGLSGSVSSVEDLQQQQISFGGVDRMEKIAEEAEDPEQESRPEPHLAAYPAQDVTGAFNENVDPAAFEMPSDDMFYSSPTFNTTWGASAGAREYQSQLIRHDSKIMASNPLTTTLPYRTSTAANNYQVDPTHMQAFREAPAPFYNHPIVPSQNNYDQSSSNQHLSAPMVKTKYEGDQPMSQNMSPIGPVGMRSESTISDLADNMGDVDVRSPAVNGQAINKAATPLAGLSTRRQRLPPPITTPRTSSFGSGSGSGSAVPASPRVGGSGSDATLRRIKSSNTIGRIQKTAASAQRSPMTTNFSHRELTRSISQQSMGISAGDSWKQDPMTPASPTDTFTSRPTGSATRRLKASKSAGNLRTPTNRFVANDPPPLPTETVPTFFSHGSHVNGHSPLPESHMSPPDTPSHAQHAFQPYNSFAPPMMAQNMAPPPVPNSAPAHQHSFNQPSQQHQQQPQRRSTASPEKTPSQHQLQAYPSSHQPVNHAQVDGLQQARHDYAAAAQWLGANSFYQDNPNPQLAMNGNTVPSSVVLAQPYTSLGFSYQPQPAPAMRDFGRAPQQPQQQQQSQAPQQVRQPQQQPQQQPPPQQQGQSHHQIQLQNYYQQVFQQPSAVSQAPPPANHQPIHDMTPKQRQRSSAGHTALNDSSRPSSAQSKAQSRAWPYTNHFTPHDTHAFTTWDLNERSASPPPRERQYSFVQWDAGNGSFTPDNKDKEKGAQQSRSERLSSVSYSKIEFLNTSPQAFRQDSGTSPVYG